MSMYQIKEVCSSPCKSFLTASISMSSSQSVCTQNSAPLFVPVTSVGLNQPIMNTLPGPQPQPTTGLAAAQSYSVPSLAGWNIPKELVALNPQLFIISQISEPGFSVAGVLPPVPGCIVNMLRKKMSWIWFFYAQLIWINSPLWNR